LSAIPFDASAPDNALFALNFGDGAGTDDDRDAI
jgi:hypothetical protein